jgi:ABC-2 type transport system ATP-binding protein
MSQKFSLYPLLTSFENIEFFGGISGISPSRISSFQDAIASEINPAILAQKTRDIPPGLRQKIALFVCLMPDPEIIFLDEPTSGVDPEVRRNFWKEIYALKQAGKTILVSTHNLDEAEYADRLIIINRGEIILEGEPAEALASSGTSSMEELFGKAIRDHEKN